MNKLWAMAFGSMGAALVLLVQGLLAPTPRVVVIKAGVERMGQSLPDAGTPTDAGPVEPDAEVAVVQDTRWETVGPDALFPHEATPAISEWISQSGEPLPEAIVWRGRPDSTTPYNLRVWADAPGGQVFAGCGFYASGEAYCKVHDPANKDEPRRAETVVTFERLGQKLRVNLSGVLTAELWPGQVQSWRLGKEESR